MRRPILLALACASLLVLSAAQQPPRGGAPAAIGPVSQIHPPRPNYTFPLGQTFVYQAEWKLWNAGLVTLTVASTGQDFRVGGTAESSGVVAVLYPVHDRLQSVCQRRRTRVRHPQKFKYRWHVHF